MKPMKCSAAKLVDYFYQKDAFFGEKPGECCKWVGTGAEKMGLTGAVDFEHLTNLAHGLDKNGEKRLVGKENGPQAHHLNAATDILLTVPKSVSIMAFKDDKLRDDIVATFTQTAEFAERFVKGRQTHDGITEEVDGKMVGMLAVHFGNRNNDPHIHGHLNILNLTERPDGSYSTVENRELFRNQSIIQQYQYNAVAKVLVEHGFEIELTKSKSGLVIPEIAGVPQELRDLFSSRHNDIQNATALKAELQERMPGLNEHQINNLLQLQTKNEKNTEITASELKEMWDVKEKSLGFDAQKFLDEAKNRVVTEKMTAGEYITMTVKDMQENESKLNLKDILFNAMKVSVGHCNGNDIENGINTAIKSGEIIQHGNMWTTPEMIKIEHGIAERAITGAKAFDSLMTKDEVAQVVANFEADKGFKMSAGQASAVGMVLTTQGRLSLIQGNPGAGKTTAFLAINNAIAGRDDIEIKGFGFQGKAAAQLEAESGIKSQTVDSFLLQKQEISDKRQLWIIDEASMLGSRQLSKMLDKAEQQNAQIILSGDGGQILSIAAGQVFSDMQKHGLVDMTSIDEVKRQKLDATGSNQYAIDTAKHFRNHEVDKAIETMQEAGKITEIADRQERLNLVAEKYIDAADQRETVCMTATNRDRKDLIDLIRDGQKLTGQIGQQDYIFKSMEPVSLTGISRRLAVSFEPENYIILTKDIGILKAGSNLQIDSIDLTTNSLKFNLNSENNKLSCIKGSEIELADMINNNPSLTINLRKDGDKVSQFKEVETSMAVGEKGIFLKNDNTEQGTIDGVKNGVTFITKDIDFETGKATIELENGKIIVRELDGANLTNGQVITVNKGQGVTADRGIAMFDSTNGNMLSENLNNVAMSRHRFEVEMVTDNVEDLVESIRNPQEKTSTLDELSDKINNMLDEARATEEENLKSIELLEAEPEQKHEAEKELSHQQEQPEQQQETAKENVAVEHGEPEEEHEKEMSQDYGMSM